MSTNHKFNIEIYTETESSKCFTQFKVYELTDIISCIKKELKVKKKDITDISRLVFQIGYPEINDKIISYTWRDDVVTDIFSHISRKEKENQIRVFKDTAIVSMCKYLD